MAARDERDPEVPYRLRCVHTRYDRRLGCVVRCTEAMRKEADRYCHAHLPRPRAPIDDGAESA